MSKILIPVGLLVCALAGCTAVLPPALYPSDPAPRQSLSTTVSYEKDIEPFLQQNCSKCHIEGKQNPGMFDTSGAAQYTTIKLEIKDMIAMIQAKAMPADNPGSVTPDQLNKLQEWAAAGAPNN